MPLGEGDVIAGYAIVRRLGAGGMGEVYLARHPRLPRSDALKVLAASVCADDEYRQRFNREADLAATLWHPHIVEVHDRGDFEGQLWIANLFSHVYSEQQSEPSYGPERRQRDDPGSDQRRRAGDRVGPQIAVSNS